MKDKDIGAFLGRDTDLEGRLTFRRTMRIDGRFKGKITSPGGDLVIGEEGKLKADIEISCITISGEIHGNIVAGQKIEIRPSGKLFGDIKTPVLLIHEGAVYKGNCQAAQTEGDEETEEDIIDLGEPIIEPNRSPGIIRGIVTGEPPRMDGAPSDVVLAVENNKKEPLKNAKIIARCEGVGKRKTKTNDSGYYELTNLEDGLWRVTVKVKDYEDVESTVEITGGGEYEKNF